MLDVMGKYNILGDQHLSPKPRFCIFLLAAPCKQSSTFVSKNLPESNIEKRNAQGDP